MPQAPPASQRKAPEIPLILVDEELWFGEPSSDAAEAAAARRMAVIAGRVVGAKPLPAAAKRLAELARDEKTSTGELVRVLEQDPALSVKLLRLVNSAGFGVRQRCTSVRHAVTLVGSEQLYRMATTAAVLDLFDTQSGQAKQVLEHSVIVAAFCRYLGGHLTLPVEELFTAGMLHDIGKLMLLEFYGDEYSQIMSECDGAAATAFLLEREKFGFEHGVLAAHVLKEWNIPDPIPKIVAWHHEPTRAYSSSTLHAAFVQTLRLADALEPAFELGKEEVEAVAKLEAANYLDISAAQLMAMYDELSTLREVARGNALTDSEERESGNRAQTGVRTKLELASPAEVPRQFRCVSCENPSFGATCNACKGYVCPDHPLDTSGWCPLCAGEYRALASERQGKLLDRNAVIATSTATLGSAGLGALLASVDGFVRGLAGGLVLSAFIVAGAWLVERLRRRTAFIKSRPDRSEPAPGSSFPRVLPK